jgi:hypothetical protein
LIFATITARWPDDKVLTLHPGMTVIGSSATGIQFRITRSDEAPPKLGMTPPPEPLPSRSESWDSALTHNPDGSGTIVIEHASRTAEVRVTDRRAARKNEKHRGTEFCSIPLCLCVQLA